MATVAAAVTTATCSARTPQPYGAPRLDAVTTLPPLTVGRFVGTWHLDVIDSVVLAAVLAGYLVALRSARRQGVRWPAYRIVAFVVLGIGTAVIATMSSVESYAKVLFWPAALQVTLLLAVMPVGIGMGDPVGLIRQALPAAMSQRWHELLTSRPVRVLTFPVVAPLLAVATQFVVFFTGYLGAAQRSGTVMHLLELQLAVTGCLFALPLLGVELLPAWCTQPVRMAIAAIDGLLDAAPGIAVMTSGGLVAAGYYGTVRRSWGPSQSWDQIIGGGLMFTIAEVIAVPFIAILFRAWVHEDADVAAAADRRLDAAEQTGPRLEDEPAPGRPWWEVDPGPLADRARRYGWTDRR